MKIGLITGEYPPMQGGVGDFTYQLATALARLGHEIHVITRVGCAGDEGRETQEDGSLRAKRPAIHPVMPHWGWRSLGLTMRLVRRLGLEVLNIQYQAAAFDLHPAINFFPLLASFSSRWPAGLILPRVGRNRQRRARTMVARCPIVVTFHDLKVPYLFPKAGPLRGWVVTLLARQVDAAIATNRRDELALAAREVRHVELIPIGSNIAPLLPSDYDRGAWRAKFGISSKDCLLGFFGFFNARKGIETLVQALAALRQAQDTALGRSYHLLFIGGTVGSSDATNRAYAEKIKRLIVDLNLTDRVHYTGYVPGVEVSAAFAAIDLCVLPYADGISFHHGTLLAALAHGQAILSTRPAIELPELTHGENVWLVPPGDVGALVDAITALGADPGRRQRLAQEAARLSAQFGWDHIAARTAELFEGVKRRA